MGNFELVKLVSLYKAYCNGMLTADTVKNEILDTRSLMDEVFYKTGEKSEDLEKYIFELEYLLFDVMRYKDEQTS